MGVVVATVGRRPAVGLKLVEKKVIKNILIHKPSELVSVGSL